MIFENLNKRQHVYEYKTDDIPAPSTIEDLLRKAWQVTPSKQNIMPYKVSVLGPNANVTKQKVYNKVVGNHIYMEDEGVKEGAISQASGQINPHYQHVLYNPYLIVFSQRVCTDNDISPYYKEQIDNGHFMEQASEQWVDKIKSTTSFEVGLFAQNLASMCLEQNIDYSFTSCFPSTPKKWKDVDFIKYNVVMLMSLGKAKTYRREILSKRSSNNDYKTAFENVVQFEE